MRHEPETQSEWDERENDRHEFFYGDPILEVETDYALEKMGVETSDPNYDFWRAAAQSDLKCQTRQEG